PLRRSAPGAARRGRRACAVRAASGVDSRCTLPRRRRPGGACAPFKHAKASLERATFRKGAKRRPDERYSALRDAMAKPTSLARFAWLSIATALATIALKAIAYVMTGSVGLLSDALESLVNLVAAVLALLMLSVSARPPDEDHAYGHTKAEYFASGAEGVLILVAAVVIGWAAVLRLLEPHALEKVGLGLVVSTFASILNFLAARILLAAGRRYRSIALEADAQHLLTDVWTSAGVLVAVGAVSVTGWQRLDPIIALLVAVNIVRTGVSLVKRSAVALLDVAWAPPE